MDRAGADVEVVETAGAGHAAGAATASVANKAHVAFARKVRPRMLMVRIEIDPLAALVRG